MSRDLQCASSDFHRTICFKGVSDSCIFLEYGLLWSAWCSLLNLSSAVSVVGSYNSGLVL